MISGFPITTWKMGDFLLSDAKPQYLLLLQCNELLNLSLESIISRFKNFYWLIWNSFLNDTF